MNSDPLGVHTWQTVSANPSDDFGIIEMTLPPPPPPPRHIIRNPSPGGLRLSPPPLSHSGSPQYWIVVGGRRRHFLFLWNLHARAGETDTIRHHKTTTHTAAQIKIQYPLTLQGSKYSLLALQGSTHDYIFLEWHHFQQPISTLTLNSTLINTFEQNRCGCGSVR